MEENISEIDTRQLHKTAVEIHCAVKKKKNEFEL